MEIDSIFTVFQGFAKPTGGQDTTKTAQKPDKGKFGRDRWVFQGPE